MIRLNVTYQEKEEAKQYGARWNGAEKFWYYPGDTLPDGLMKWSMSGELPEKTPVLSAYPEEAPALSAWLKDYQTVSDVNQMILNRYGDIREFRNIMVWGEVTNYRNPTGGNYYFDIKDANALLSCIMWGSVAASMPGFTLKAGMTVAIVGYLDYYPASGKTSLKVRQIRDAGEGEAALALLRLHARLEAEGLFDEKYKKQIPKYPSTVGVVTSKDGQAIQDICKTAADRNPYVQLILYHVKVQGKYAAETIVKGIQVLDQMGVDTIIVGRGGGSDEELKAYNDEKVVRAVFQMKTPVISAIGHEGNWSLTDYAADYRESTPTKAAVKAFPDVMTDLKHIEQLRQTISSQARNNLLRRKLMLDAIVNKLESFHPQTRLKENRERLQRCLEEMQIRLAGMLEDRHRRVQTLSAELMLQAGSNYESRRHRWEVLTTQLHGLSPTAKLVRGFGYISIDGKPVTSVEQVQEGDRMLVYIYDGQIHSRVTQITKNRLLPEETAME